MTAFAGSVTIAKECQVTDGHIAKAGDFIKGIANAIETEPRCEAAYQILESCQVGSTADNALSVLVLLKCEPEFLPDANAATRAAYKNARAKCEKIARKDGTMYQGRAAICMARAGRNFARQFRTKI